MGSLALFAPLESLLNRNIAASTPAREILRRLSGRAFAVEIGTPEGGRLLRLRLLAGATGLTLDGGDAAADAAVSGTPLALAALLARRAEGDSGASGVTISGDAAIAEAFEKLLGLARPDLEEELARLAGDVPAHYAGVAARAALGWLGKARASLARNVGEFLTEESRDLVARAELDSFLADVDVLRDDLERTAARLALLERKLGGAR
jgi:ubiquinone biosynthesis accessory factor UbiJ